MESDDDEDEVYLKNPTGQPTKRRNMGVSVRSLDQVQLQVAAFNKIN